MHICRFCCARKTRCTNLPALVIFFLYVSLLFFSAVGPAASGLVICGALKSAGRLAYCYLIYWRTGQETVIKSIPKNPFLCQPLALIRIMGVPGAHRSGHGTVIWILRSLSYVRGVTFFYG